MANLNIEAGDILQVVNGWQYRIAKYETTYMLIPLNHAGRVIQISEEQLISYCDKHELEGAKIIKR